MAKYQQLVNLSKEHAVGSSVDIFTTFLDIEHFLKIEFLKITGFAKNNAHDILFLPYAP